MTYKIFILEVDDPIKPLYSPLIIKTIGTNRSISFEEYETDNIEELQLKISELMQTLGINGFRVVSDITFEFNVNVPRICICPPEEDDGNLDDDTGDGSDDGSDDGSGEEDLDGDELLDGDETEEI